MKKIIGTIKFSEVMGSYGIQRICADVSENQGKISDYHEGNSILITIQHLFNVTIETP